MRTCACASYARAMPEHWNALHLRLLSILYTVLRLEHLERRRIETCQMVKKRDSGAGHDRCAAALPE